MKSLTLLSLLTQLLLLINLNIIHVYATHWRPIIALHTSQNTHFAKFAARGGSNNPNNNDSIMDNDHDDDQEEVANVNVAAAAVAVAVDSVEKNSSNNHNRTSVVEVLDDDAAAVTNSNNKNDVVVKEEGCEIEKAKKKFGRKLRNRNSLNIKRKVTHAAFGMFFAACNQIIPQKYFLRFIGTCTGLSLFVELMRFRKVSYFSILFFYYNSSLVSRLCCNNGNTNEMNLISCNKRGLVG